MIYLCFTFYRELELLEIRLKELWDVVGKFVICESEHSHTGRKKPLYYRDNQSRFSAYKNKIISLVHKSPRASNPWVNLQSQMNYVVYGLGNAKSEDTIVVSDADEIPRQAAIHHTRHFPYGKIRTRTYAYKFNVQMIRDGHDNDYHSTFGFAKLKFMQTPLLLWMQKGKNEMRDGGWHFDWLYSADIISEKIGDMAHTEYNTPYFRNAKRIRHCIDNNLDLFDNNAYKLVTVPLNAPRCVMENKEKYEDYINGHPMSCDRPAAEG